MLQGTVEPTTDLYPVYQIHSREDGEPTKTSERFKLGDPQFRSKTFRLPTAESYATFEAWREGNQLVIQVDYDVLKAGEQGELMLLFDPDCSYRKFCNAFAFIVQEDGNLVYREYQFEAMTPPVPAEVEFVRTVEQDRIHVQLSIPFQLLRLRPDLSDRRLIGFNAVRTIYKDDNPSPEQTVYLTWSGVKGDRIQFGQGNGRLLFTQGLSEREVQELVKRAADESGTYFAQWKRNKVPQELQSFMKDKKRGLTVYVNAEETERARTNAATTDWGRRMKDEILKVADYWAGKSDEELFHLVPVGNPREVSPSVFFGDPLSGGRGTTFQMCLERPYQYYNSVTKEWWYNGKKFHNPTTGEELTLQDDGEGFVAPDGFPNPGVRYMFTASYRLFIWAMLLGNPRTEVLEDREVCPETSGCAYAGAIPYLAYAYQLTLDKTYARKALVLIGRIAELYPYMNGKFPSSYDTVQIAEPTTSESFWLCNYFVALDLIYDTVDELQPQLSALFSEKPGADLRPRTNVFDLKQVVYEMIPVVLYSCEIEKLRTADWSLRWIATELVVASFMQSGKLMYHILYEGKASLQSKVRNSFFRDGRYAYDSMNYIQRISEQICLMANHNYRFRDEAYFPEEIDMFEDAQFGLNRTVQLYCDLKCGTLTAMFGDVKGINNQEPISEARKAGKFPYSPTLEIVYRRMKSFRNVIGPVLARYGVEELENNRVQSVKVTNETKNLVETKYKLAFLLLATAGDTEEYRQYADETEPSQDESIHQTKLESQTNLIQPSLLLEDSQVSIFRTGTTPHNCKHVVLYGQPSAGHHHGDKLGLWIGAYGYHLLTGIGDYPYTWVSPKWSAWEVHSAACTVVVVDGQEQALSHSSQKCHYQGRLLQVSGMENTTAYPGTHLERWCYVIQAPNAEDAYVVDVNDVAGGETFDYNTMGLDSSFEQVRFEGLEDAGHDIWTAMKGTLAGEEVSLYSQPGYGWMKSVKKAKLRGAGDATDNVVSWTYQYGNAALRIHAVPDTERTREIVCALGERGGQEPGKSKWEPFVMWRDSVGSGTKWSAEHDTGAVENHTATFVSVLEPHELHPFIQSVRPLSLIESQTTSHFKPVGIEVEYADGVRDIVISNSGASCAADGWAHFQDGAGIEYKTDARLFMLRYHEHRVIDGEALGYSFIRVKAESDAAANCEIRRESAAYTGTIVNVDIEARKITVELDGDYVDLPDVTERVAIIDSSDYVKPSTYYLHNPLRDGKTLTFGSGMSLVLMDEDWGSPHKLRSLGRKRVVNYHGKNVYVDVKPGDTFTLLNWTTDLCSRFS